jgi:hypothetical protein
MERDKYKGQWAMPNHKSIMLLAAFIPYDEARKKNRSVKL